MFEVPGRLIAYFGTLLVIKLFGPLSVVSEIPLLQYRYRLCDSCAAVLEMRSAAVLSNVLAMLFVSSVVAVHFHAGPK